MSTLQTLVAIVFIDEDIIYGQVRFQDDRSKCAERRTLLVLPRPTVIGREREILHLVALRKEFAPSRLASHHISSQLGYSQGALKMPRESVR